MIFVTLLEPTAADGAAGAVGKTQEGVNLIVDGNLASFLAARRRGPLPVDGLAIGTHGLNIAHQITRHGQQMAAQVRQGAARLRGFAPPRPRRHRIGHEVFAELTLKTDDLAKVTVVDQLTSQRDDRVVLIVVAHPGDDACRLRRQAHGTGLFEADGQGLFAIHRFACRQGRHGHGVVQVVGGGDGDQLHLGIINQLLPVVVGLFKAPGIGAVKGALRVGIGEGRQAHCERQVEHCADVPKGQGMGAPHEACTDEYDSECLHDGASGVGVVRRLTYGI